MSRELRVNRFTTTAQGLVPAPGAATGKFLGDDGNWHQPAPSGGGSGTVTSVDITPGSSAITSAGGPVTTAGDITVDLSAATKAQLASIPVVGVPATIPDLQLWWTSSNILATAGNPIIRFQELTPWITGALNLETSSGLTSSVTIDSTQLNGLNMAKWAAASAPSSILLANHMPVIGAGTFFAVIKPGAATVATQCILGGITGALAFYLQANASNARIGLVKTNTAVIGTATNVWTPGTAFQCNATYVASTGAFAFRQARAANGTGTGTTTAGGTLGSDTATIQWIGSDVNNATNMLNAASIGELMVYNRALTPTEITTVETYLLVKWGV